MIIVIAAMFLIRWILYSNGTIDDMYTLDEDELLSSLESAEVTIEVVSPDGSEREIGAGTILDGRKNSTDEENYTLTIASSMDLTGIDSEAVEIEVTLPDGTITKGELFAYGEEEGYVLLQCECVDELEVYYSEDLLYRLEEDDPAYILVEGEVVPYEITDKDAVTSMGEELIFSSLEEEVNQQALKGCGLYGKSGNYLGLIIQVEEGGDVYAVPGNVIMKGLNAAL